MPESYIDVKITDRVATIRMNRPDKHNAFDEQLIDELSEAFEKADIHDEVRVLVLEAAGPSFSAGADLNWMKRAAAQGFDENLRDAAAFADLMGIIDNCRNPVLGIVQGAAFGGGVGLAACCDIVIAAEEATFCLSEVRLGLIPSVISPYVVAAIGPRACRRYFLTAERFDAATALRLGLVHEVVPRSELTTARDNVVSNLLKGGPVALQKAKTLIRDVLDAQMGLMLDEETARRIAEIRASDEGKEGVSAFLEKRKPNWQ
jgi:methylglutaconyl-CoA hydratase